jgi:hypothetical protein
MDRDLNKLLTFIPISDIEAFCDYDAAEGYGGSDMIFLEDGILVKTDVAEGMKKHVAEIEAKYSD